MDAEFITDLFSRFRPVIVRRMFGGQGLIVDGATFGIVFEGVIYLRADIALVPAFKEAGSSPFVYPYTKRPYRRKNPDTSPFWRMPEFLYDDPEEAARWAERSFAVAQAKQAGKQTRKIKSAAKKAAPKPVKAKRAAPAKKPSAKKAASAKARKPKARKSKARKSLAKTRRR